MTEVKRCIAPECPSPVLAKGMCNRHYKQMATHGHFIEGRQRHYCLVEGCGRGAHGHGMCSTHYSRWANNGDPLALRSIEVPGGPVDIPLRDADGDVKAYTVVDGIDSVWLNRWRWSLSPSGYAYRTEAGRTLLLARLLLGIADAGPIVEADHINRDRLDNRRKNLRVVTSVGNAANRGGVYA